MVRMLVYCIVGQLGDILNISDFIFVNGSCIIFNVTISRLSPVSAAPFKLKHRLTLGLPAIKHNISIDNHRIL